MRARARVRVRGEPFRRRVAACTIMMALFGLMGACKIASGAVVPAADALEAAVSPSVGFEAVLNGASDAHERAARESGDAFAEELVSVTGRDGARIDEAARVMGWTCEGEVAEALASVREELERKGWTGSESGQPGCLSFSKARGEYRWAFLSCTKVGSSVSVVIRFA